MTSTYEPFIDDGEAPLDVQSWPKRKPVPDTVTTWTPEESEVDATVGNDEPKEK